MRIAIIGYSGSGKSTLAKKLGGYYRAEILHLDSVHWLPGWQERPLSEEQKIVNGFMDRNASWVIEGNYRKVAFERRLKEADLIIFMNFPRRICFFRAWKRYFTYRGKTREDMGEGCPEKMDWTFIRWILHDGRSKRHREAFRKVQEDYREKVVVIRNPRELKNFLTTALTPIP